MQKKLPEYLKHVLNLSKSILTELKKDEPSADRIAALYRNRTPHLERLQDILKRNEELYSNDEKQDYVLSNLNEVASLDAEIMSYLDKLKQEKGQELQNLRKEIGTVTSYQKTDAPSKSFFINEGVKG